MPDFALTFWRERKRDRTRKVLAQQERKGLSFATEHLLQQLAEMGICNGDHLMVHAAMSKIGHLKEGPKTVVDALQTAVGETGTICMPSSPVKLLQLDHIRQEKTFDVLHTPSAMGAISEYFRKLPETVRSCHPTEPVCANGALATELVKDHFGEPTPYTVHSPWKKLMEAGGKILYVGVTLDNAGTHLHTLEDGVAFKYPVYDQAEFEVTCINAQGVKKAMRTKVHNPEFSKRRKCDGLMPMFERRDVLSHHKLGAANCLLLDAKRMFEVMVEEYEEKGITMYTPNGEKIPGFDD